MYEDIEETFNYSAILPYSFFSKNAFLGIDIYKNTLRYNNKLYTFTREHSKDYAKLNKMTTVSEIFNNMFQDVDSISPDGILGTKRLPLTNKKVVEKEDFSVIYAIYDYADLTDGYVDEKGYTYRISKEGDSGIYAQIWFWDLSEEPVYILWRMYEEDNKSAKIPEGATDLFEQIIVRFVESISLIK